MINRENWLAVKMYIDYHERIMQRSPKTTKRKWAHLRHLLNWAAEIPFPEADTIPTVFPQYLLTARNDGHKRPLSASSMQRACREARSFYQWAATALPVKYQSVSPIWVASLRPPRSHGKQATLQERKVFTLDMVQAVTRLKPQTIKEQRDQAAIAFLFLSGMRIGAFVTLPIHCVDIAKQRVQLPKYGVKTKYHKAAVTSLLPLPKLLEVVTAWDTLVKRVQPPKALWYPILSRDGMQFGGWTGETSDHRRQDFSRGLRHLCKRAGLERSHPHAIRHEHAIYALKHVKTVEEFKAVSQNIMHSNMVTTDTIYSKLTNDNVHDVIASLGAKRKTTAPGTPVDLEKLARVLQAIHNDPGILDTILGMM